MKRLRLSGLEGEEIEKKTEVHVPNWVASQVAASMACGKSLNAEMLQDSA